MVTDLNGRLFDFQKEGVDFLLGYLPESFAPHRLLADDMGLGKSIQACAAIQIGGIKKVLLICQASMKETWQRYLLEWTEFKQKQIQILWTGKDQVADLPVTIVNFELVIVKTVLQQLHDTTYDLILVDEAQRLKSFTSKITNVMLAQTGKRAPLISKGKRKWLLSGTIMPNRAIELWPIIKTLAPECIRPHEDYTEYGKYFCNGFKEYAGWNFKGASHIEELRERLKPFMLRREKHEVYRQLPDKIIEPIYCTIPDLGFDIDDTPMATVRKAIGKAKVPFVVQFLVDKLQVMDRKIVVFAYSREAIRLIADDEKLEKYDPVFVYGGMKYEDKKFALKYFKDVKTCKVLILQMLAAGTGTDGIQESSNIVVFAEWDWSGATPDQAMDRLHRIGQNKTVVVYPIYAKGTLDEPMNGVYHNKKKVINSLLSNRLIEGKCSNINCLGTNKPGSCKCSNSDEENLMSLEIAIERLANAIERIAVKLEGTELITVDQAVKEKTEVNKVRGGRPPSNKEVIKEVPKKKESKQEELNHDDIRKICLQITANCPDGKDEGKAQISKVVRGLGYKLVSDVPEDEFPELMKGLKRVLGTFVPDADESDDVADY